MLSTLAQSADAAFAHRAPAGRHVLPLTAAGVVTANSV
jgi:hypothetical protein